MFYFHNTDHVLHYLPHFFFLKWPYLAIKITQGGINYYYGIETKKWLCYFASLKIVFS